MFSVVTPALWAQDPNLKSYSYAVGLMRTLVGSRDVKWGQMLGAEVEAETRTLRSRPRPKLKRPNSY